MEPRNSGVLTSNCAFDHRFIKPGVFSYFCSFHGKGSANGMAGGTSGTITVATIVWGDGTTSTDGHDRRTGNGRYTVSGSHAYGAAGWFRAVITVRDAQGWAIAGQDQVQVGK
ncbi:MAG: hypothetical protein JWN86_4226 [Planctomycetota bacterium]|nr:hypothetical protein [Planctomycetota bacterium]